MSKKLDEIYEFMEKKIDSMSLQDLREFAKYEYWNTLNNLSEEELETEKESIGFTEISQN